MPVAFSISVLSCDRKSKAFSSRTADPSNLRPVMHQSKIAVETKCNSIKLAFLNIRSLKNKSFVYQCKQVSFGQYLSFEYLGIVLKGAPRILFIIIYRPPKYSPAFVEEFTELLSMISSEFDCFAIAGDFNIHIDNAEIKTTK